MLCPFGCGGVRHRMVQKRMSAGGHVDKRRCERLTCHRRFTTKESVDWSLLKPEMLPSEHAIPTAVEVPQSCDRAPATASRFAKPNRGPSRPGSPPSNREHNEPICEPHFERQGVRISAEKTVAGTWMCRDCWAGVSFRDEEPMPART
jgi:hypothetical protein